MKLNEVLSKLPDNKRALVVISGGLDSTIALRLALQKYGKNNVGAITFDYGQKQEIEISYAKDTTSRLKISHDIIPAGFLHEISLGFSANVDENIPVPDIKEVLGDPQPKTYVPNRNMILLSIAAAYAETRGFNLIICGLQVHDLYGYHDTSQRFIDKMNSVLDENRKNKIEIIAPFTSLSKVEELNILQEMDGNVDLARSTFTCYNPQYGISCGKCASCAERIMNFAKFGCEDPLIYNIDINWKKLIEKYQEKVPSAQ